MGTRCDQWSAALGGIQADHDKQPEYYKEAETRESF